METKSLKALSHAVLQRNIAGNNKETLSFYDGNYGGVDNSKCFQSKTQGNTTEPLDPEDVESLFKLLKMTLSDFKKAGLLVRIRCRHLNGEEVFIASSEKEAAIGRAEGLICYLADELHNLIKGKSTPEEVRAVHQVKTSLNGVLTDVIERKESKPVRKRGREMEDRNSIEYLQSLKEGTRNRYSGKPSKPVAVAVAQAQKQQRRLLLFQVKQNQMQL